MLCTRSVVIAVLLDNFISSVTNAKELANDMEEHERSKKKICGILDPITSMLTSFDDEADLIHRIDDIFQKLDTDESGGLDYQEFRVNVRGLPGGSRIKITKDDWDVLTEGGRFLGPEGEFNQLQFRDMMKGELERFSRRELANVIAFSDSDEFKSTVVMLKLLQGSVVSEIKDALRTSFAHASQVWLPERPKRPSIAVWREKRLTVSTAYLHIKTRRKETYQRDL